MRGEVLEIGATDLAFDESETEAFLVQAGMRFTPERIRQLLQRTEGWPAGLVLFALARSEDAQWIGSTAVPDRVVSDFIRSEVLADLPAETSSFLHRTAILDVLCPSLCDAVLASTKSAAILESLVAANLFITPLDAEGEWFRYHSLFRAVLLDEIVRSSGPDTVAGLHLRAARWWADAGAVEPTIEHSRAGGDLTVATRLLVRELPQAYNTGRLDVAQKWLSELGDATIERDPLLAGLAGWHAALSGNAVVALRWADHIEQLAPAGVDGNASFVSGRAALRAFLCAHGIEQMEADAASVVAGEPIWGGWRPASLGFLAVARWLRGDDAGASALFSESIESASALGRGDPEARNLAYRAVLSMDRDDWASAEIDIHRANSVIEAVHLSEYGVNAIVRAAQARWLLHHNQTERGRAVLLEAMRLRTSLTWANPWAAVWVRLEMADAHLTSADPHGARVLLHEVDEILYRRPKLGRLGARADKLRDTLANWPMDGHGTTLSTAELRLLPYLQTHLSLKEIGERLYVSRNTVSTQTNSIYRKLAVSGRSEAVDRARQLGLLAPSIFERAGVDSL
jgi:LuxR family maltose regulon positive regulatory protein